MKKQLLIPIFLLASIGGIYLAWPNHTVSPSNSTPVVEKASVSYPKSNELFVLVNEERTKIGLPALIHDPELDVSATAKCQDEVTHNYHAHFSPSGVAWQSFFPKDEPSTYIIGENLSWNHNTGDASKATVEGWMHSPGHRANILNPRYNHVGYAVCKTGTNGNEVVQHFSGT